MQPYTYTSQPNNFQRSPTTAGFLFTPNIFNHRAAVFQDEQFFESDDWYNFLNLKVCGLFTHMLPTFNRFDHQATIDRIHETDLHRQLIHTYEGHLWDRGEIATPAMHGQVSLSFNLRLHYLLADIQTTLANYQNGRPVLHSLQFMKNKDCVVYVYFTAHCGAQNQTCGSVV